jgi:hypothetical protein
MIFAVAEFVFREDPKIYGVKVEATVPNAEETPNPSPRT